MSAATPPSTAPAQHHTPPAKKEPNEITIISHSNLFYWWPVWAFGFLMAIITYFQGYVMAIVPARDVAAATNADVTIKTHTQNEKEGLTNEVTRNDQVVIYAPQASDSANEGVPVKDGVAQKPHLRVSPNRLVGVVFLFVLLMVIFISNVPLRGMWSLLVIVVGVALVVIFILLNWIEFILSALSVLDVRINMAGYVTISVFLLIVWLVAVLVFDKQRYITFTAGQFKVCEEIGGGEQVYSTDGLTLQKQRSDFFRHYILGLGSGDLIVRTAGAQAHHIDLPNVLFINSKVRQIEELIARKTVIETQG